MKQLTVSIVTNRRISDTFFQLIFRHPDLERPAAGQFFTVQLPAMPHRLLRRPFAFSSWDEERKEAGMLYQIRGEGTRALAGLTPGQTLSVIAPLGKGFPLPASEVIAVAGGIGLGPVLYAARVFAQKGISVTAVAGFKNKGAVPAADCLPPSVSLTTDDGSLGFHGTVADFLEARATQFSPRSTVISCGPLPMMKTVTEWCNRRGFPSFVSMEAMMGCGVGACMGCVIPTTDDAGYARVCLEGPVFNANRIQWEALS